jgi:hypothetical protein
MTNASFYYDTLYPFQDAALKVIRSVDTGFYLTGGTAASRGYLHHRFSDDLDLFASDDDRFGLWVDRIIQALVRGGNWQSQVVLREERFGRLNLIRNEITLKIEMINDVPARVGVVVDHPILGYMDTAENILANKITALLDREEPKDFADIWGFCTKMGLSMKEAITNAESKAAGVFPADLARLLCTATEADWATVRWVHPPPVRGYLSDLNALGEKLLLV